jgi:DNA recombination-dependent growth factor C
MWFKNLRVYRLAPNWAYGSLGLQSSLERLQFTPAGACDMTAFGWVPPRPDTGLVYAQDDQLLIALRIEKKLLPASVVDQFARAKAREIEEHQGYKPGRKQMKEIKEQVTDELLPKAFSSYRDTRVWIDTRNRWLVVDTASSAVADAVLGAVAKVLDPFPIAPLYTEYSPAVAMTNWLVWDEPPTNFSIDQDTELQSNRESAAKVRYQRLCVDLDDIRKHVEAGRTCTRLALTWADRVSFVLTDGLEVRRIAPLDVLQQGRQMAETEADQFDSDFALMTGELSRLLGDLVEALGGEKETTQ